VAAEARSRRSSATELGTTVPRVALAWVQGRPGVASSIISARSIDQLHDNLSTLEVRLTAAHVQTLDKAPAPALPFPTDILALVPTFADGSTTIDGQPSEP
jgi:aryl-alcohol dehydrogenase-like predicted oxidoreductase